MVNQARKSGRSGHFHVMTAIAGTAHKDTIVLEHMRPFGQRVVCPVGHAGIEMHVVGGDEILLTSYVAHCNIYKNYRSFGCARHLAVADKSGDRLYRPARER